MDYSGRLFAELPEEIRNSNGAILVTSIESLTFNRINSTLFSRLNNLVAWDFYLKRDNERTADTVKLMFRRQENGEDLCRLLDQKNFAELIPAMTQAGFQPTEWTVLQGVGRIMANKRWLVELAGVKKEFSEYVTLEVAMLHAVTSAHVSDDMQRLEVGLTAIPAAYGSQELHGDKILNKNVTTALSTAKRTYLGLRGAVAKLSDGLLTEFLQRPEARALTVSEYREGDQADAFLGDNDVMVDELSGATSANDEVAEFRRDVDQLPMSPELARIEMYNHRCIQELQRGI